MFMLPRAAQNAIEDAAHIIGWNNFLENYFNDSSVVDDETDYKQYVINLIEDYFWDTNKVKYSFSDWAKSMLTGEEVAELKKKLNNDYSNLTQDEADAMIIEDAINYGLI